MKPKGTHKMYRGHAEAVDAMRSGGATGQGHPSDPERAARRKAEALASLPAELHPIFLDLYEEYRLLSYKHTGAKLVHAFVIRDLVLSGWRRSADERSPSGA